MKKLETLLMAFAFGIFLISCGGGAKSEEAASEEPMAEEDSAGYSMQTSIGIMHEVADVEAWNAFYEANSDPDSRIVVLTSNENANNLFVFNWTKNHETAKAFYGSDEFKALTDSSGVVGEIQMTYYDVKEVDDQPALTYVLASGHEVADYDAWKMKFDEDADARANGGVKFEALATDADNPNMVYLMFSTNDLDAAMEMFNSDELKQKMAEAGVIGEPQVSVWLSPIKEEEDVDEEGA